jgi:tetratricopeptide (TPR) repeat protein
LSSCATLEFNKEIANCKAKLGLHPEDVTVLNDYAYALNGIGGSEKAREIIEKVFTLNPGYRQAQLTLAKIYEKTGNIAKAQEALRRAKSLSAQSNFIDRELKNLKSQIAVIAASKE